MSPPESDSSQGRVVRNKRVSCTECEDFVFTKSYAGAPDTPGEEEYKQSGGFDECPVCGGEIVESEVGADAD